jgi:hypothetical protein
MARRHLLQPTRSGRVSRLHSGVLGVIPASYQSGPATCQDSGQVCYTPRTRPEIKLMALHESPESSRDTAIIQLPTMDQPRRATRSRVSEAADFLNFLHLLQRTQN